MKYSQLKNMLRLVIEKQSNQRDLAGKPYILHLLRVMLGLNSDDEELNCIALGHDLLEDGYPSKQEGLDDLYRIGFSKRVIDGIYSLTKGGSDSYDEYLDMLIKNPDAILVKLADLRDNMDLSRFDRPLTATDVARQAKYFYAYKKLERFLNDKAKR